MESSFKAVRRPESNRVPCNWNIAPSQDVLVIRFNPKTGLPAAFWISLIWSILSTVVISGSFHFFDDLPDRDEAILLTFVWLPAGIICEKLGFGGFSVIGSGTIPNWIFFTAMVVTSYLYSLILVFLVRFVIRFGKTLWLKGNSKEQDSRL